MLVFNDHTKNIIGVHPLFLGGLYFGVRSPPEISLISIVFQLLLLDIHHQILGEIFNGGLRFEVEFGLHKNLGPVNREGINTEVLIDNNIHLAGEMGEAQPCHKFEAGVDVWDDFEVVGGRPAVLGVLGHAYEAAGDMLPEKGEDGVLHEDGDRLGVLVDEGRGQQHLVALVDDLGVPHL